MKTKASAWKERRTILRKQSKEDLGWVVGTDLLEYAHVRQALQGSCIRQGRGVGSVDRGRG